jgi:hypothetical protein
MLPDSGTPIDHLPSHAMKDAVRPPTTHIFRVFLAPRLYRDIEIGSARSLYELAEAIIAAFGFSFDHAFGYYSNVTGDIYASALRYELFADLGPGHDAISVKRTPVGEAFLKPRQKMLFLFDYGDEWRFRVELRDRGARAGGRARATITGGAGKAPAQYPDPDDDEA